MEIQVNRTIMVCIILIRHFKFVYKLIMGTEIEVGRKRKNINSYKINIIKNAVLKGDNYINHKDKSVEKKTKEPYCE